MSGHYSPWMLYIIAVRFPTAVPIARSSVKLTDAHDDSFFSHAYGYFLGIALENMSSKPKEGRTAIGVSP